MNPARKVLLISIDGLRSEFYLDKRYDMPTVRWLAARGTSARRALPCYPTVTLTNHATIATGVSPAVHGIVGNTEFRVTNGEFRDWLLRESQLRAPTLWQHARRAGLSTALLRWPTTLGAQADVVVPELFGESPDCDRRGWAWTLESSTPAFMAEIRDQVTELEPRSHAEYDEWAAAATAHLVRTRQPDLTLVHFVSLDHAQHDHGCASREARETVAACDARLERIVSAVDLANTAVIVLGDHGFFDIDQRYHLNALFARQGWITVSSEGSILDWSVIAHINCAQAAVYVREPALEGRVLELLRRESADSTRVFELLERDLLDRLVAFPGALCAVDCLPGFGLGESLSGELIERLPRLRSDHGPGYLWSHPCMQAGFVAAGAGVERGKELGTLRLVDVAPTVAALLGLRLESVEGRDVLADPAVAVSDFQIPA